MQLLPNTPVHVAKLSDPFTVTAVATPQGCVHIRTLHVLSGCQSTVTEQRSSVHVQNYA